MSEEKNSKREIVGSHGAGPVPPGRRSWSRIMMPSEWMWTGVAAAILLVSVGLLLISLRHYSTLEYGVRTVELPWSGEGIAVTGVASQWELSGTGTELYCPRVMLDTRIGSGEAGDLIVRFLDHEGRQMGDPFVFTYGDGVFRNQDGRTVTACCSKGLEGKGAINEYIYDAREPWRYTITYAKQGQPVRYLGSGDVARVLK